MIYSAPYLCSPFVNISHLCFMTCILFHTVSKYMVGFISVSLILNDPKPIDHFRGRLLNPGLVTLLLKCPERYQTCLKVSVRYGAVDYLSEIMTAHGHGSTLQYIKLHRSKCACLIKTINLPALRTDLIDDFQNKKYAIILDESIGISTQKHLCMLV
jgi:hypothetical protein